MSLYEIDFRIITNADWREDFELKEAGVPWDLTGAALVCSLRKRRISEDTPALVIGTGPGTILVTNAVLGLFSIAVPALALADLEAGPYEHDCILTQAGIKTPLWLGKVDIVRGITP